MKSRRPATRCTMMFLLPCLLFGLLCDEAAAESDLSIKELRTPTGTLELDVPLTIDFDVRNSGADPSVKGEVYVSIYYVPESGEDERVYFEILKISVPSNGVITPSLPTWTPDREGTYEIEITLFAVNETMVADNGRLEKFTVGSVVEPTCTEAAPVRSTKRGDRDIPNITEAGIGSGETLKVTYSTGDLCCWNMNVQIEKLQGEGMMILDEAPAQRSEGGSPAAYTLRLSSTTAIKDLAAFNAHITWNRCDSPQVMGSETIMVIFMPEPGLASGGQKTTAANPAAGKSGDPVNTATGELFIPWTTDLSIGVNPPLSFRRYYAANLRGFFAPTESIGTNWSHNYAWRIEQIDSIAIVIMPSGRRILFRQNAEGWSLRDRHETLWQLVEEGNLWRFGDPRRSVVRLFDRSGVLTAIVDRAGNRRSMVWDGGNLIAVEDDHGRRLELGYTSGKITSVSDGSRTLDYEYRDDLLVGVRDPRGNRTTLAYNGDERGLLTEMVRPEGNNPFTQTYDAEGRVLTQTDATGGEWGFAYGDGVTTITGPDGTTEEHHHSEGRELRTRVDQEENSFTVEYDDRGRPVAVIDRLGDTTRTTYDGESGLPASITGADGGTTSYEWRGTSVDGITFHDLVRVSYPDGTRKEVTYNSAGYPTNIVDRNGKTTAFAYDDAGRMTGATLPNGETTMRTYGPTGLLDSVIGPDGGATVVFYDRLDRPIAVKAPDGTTNRITYDANNNRTVLIDGSGDSLRYEYDGNNNLIGMTDREGGRTELVYDRLDRRIATIDPEGRRSSLVYDSRGRFVAVVNGAEDTLRVGYDLAGRAISLIDPEGNRLRREVDAEGVTGAFVNQQGERWTIESDRMGRVTGTTDPLGRSTTREYDEIGRIVGRTDAAGREQAFDYDDEGRLSEWTMPGEITASYSYSEIGFLTSITDPLGNRWTYTQDANGQLAGEKDPHENETNYRYDGVGRLIEVTLPGDLGSITFTRDVRGNATDIVYSDRPTERFTYDRDGRRLSGPELTLSRDRSGLIDTVNGIAVQRDGAGRVSQLIYAPGKEITYRYDHRGLLTEVIDWVGGSTSFGWDDAGRLISLSRPNGVATEWSYDAVGRLTEIAEGDLARITLQFDELGRTTSAERTGYLMPTISNDTTTRAYDAASQIREASYDEIGRPLEESQRLYRWDAASRLVGMTERDGTSSSWEYDGEGNVVARGLDGEEIRSVRNYALARQNVAIDRTSDGADARYYVQTPSGYLLHSIDAADNDRSFYHYDEVGSTLLMSDESGAITDRYAYTPYGLPAGREGESENRYTFVGAWGVEQETETGLYRMGARLYDASSARFITRDPARLIRPKQLNPYRYALGNPLRYVDIDGREESVAQRDLMEVSEGNPLDDVNPLALLAKVFYGTSTPPDSRLAREPIGNDENDEIDGLNDREVIFGSGDVGSTYTPGQRGARTSGLDAPLTERQIPGPIPGPFDSVERPFIFPEGTFGGLTNPTEEKSDVIIPLFPKELPEGYRLWMGTPKTDREAPTKIFIEGVKILIPKGTILIFPPVLLTPDPDDEEDPFELGDGEEIL